MADKLFSVLPPVADGLQSLLLTRRPDIETVSNREGFKDAMNEAQPLDDHRIERDIRDSHSHNDHQQQRENPRGNDTAKEARERASGDTPASQEVTSGNRQKTASTGKADEAHSTADNAGTSSDTESDTTSESATTAIASEVGTLILDESPETDGSIAVIDIATPASNDKASVTVPEVLEESAAKTLVTDESITTAPATDSDGEAATRTSTVALATEPVQATVNASATAANAGRDSALGPRQTPLNSSHTAGAATTTLSSPAVAEAALHTVASGDTTAIKAQPSVTTQLSLDGAASNNKSVAPADIALTQAFSERAVQKATPNSESNTALQAINRLAQPQAATAASGLKPQTAVTTPFSQPQWGQAVTEKVMWMSSQNIKEAEVHLDPPELGPIQVKVSVQQDQAHVSFTVQNASVREALDQNAMRLREMFSGEGLDLVDVDVSDQSQTQQDTQGEEGTSRGASNRSNTTDDDNVSESSVSSTTGYSLVDAYV